MAYSRYKRAPTIGFNYQYGTSNTHVVIKNAIANKTVSFKTIVLNESQRLDHLAAIYYGDAKYWWILAAASNIGWALQLPPGTIINIPEFSEISKYIG